MPLLVALLTLLAHGAEPGSPITARCLAAADQRQDSIRLDAGRLCVGEMAARGDRAAASAAGNGPAAIVLAARGARGATLTGPGLTALANDLAGDSKTSPYSQALELLLEGSARAADRGLPAEEVGARLQVGLDRILAATPFGIPPRLGAAARVGHWRDPLAELVSFAFDAGRKRALDPLLPRTLTTLGRAPGCAPELGSGCYPEQPWGSFDEWANAPRGHAQQEEAMRARPTAATFAAAWEVALAEGDPSCALGLLTIWLQIAPDEELASAPSVRALTRLPTLVELLADAADDAQVGPRFVAERGQRIWRRAATVLLAARKDDEAFRVISTIAARRVIVERAEQRALRTPTLEQQAAVRSVQSQLVSLDRIRTLTASASTASTSAPGLFEGYTAARAALRALVPYAPTPGIALARERLRAQGAVLLVVDAASEPLTLHLIGPTRWDRVVVPPPSGASSALAAAVDCTKRVRRALLAGQVDDGRALAGDLHLLHELLVAPVAASIPEGARMYVVDEGPLAGVPFEALLTDGPGPGGVDWRQAPYLGVGHTIVHLPNPAWLSLPADAPTTGNAAPRVVLAGKSTFTPLTGARTLPSLSGVPGELDAVALRFADTEVRRLCDGDCPERPTKALLARAAAAADIVHIASHGAGQAHAWLRQVGLSGAYLVVESGSGASAAWWGEEIQATPMSPSLVVLSACDTRLADGDSLEGGLGLARSFLVAGARSVVATRWALADDLPRRFFLTFYDRYRAGAGPAEALTAAQAHLRGHGYSFPGEWATFALVGEPD